MTTADKMCYACLLGQEKYRVGELLAECVNKEFFNVA